MATENPYDAIAYPSAAYRLTHPDRLACQGRLFALATVEPGRCRYLELGCGSGMNLLAMAAELPAAHFLGIDLAAAPIAEAQRHAAELQLANVSFLQGDLLEMVGALGEFDYIVAHGVFSWVPEAVRHALLELCRVHLAPQGVAYISYNALPGCRIRQMVRDMLRYHVRDVAHPQQRQEQVRSLMRFLVAGQIAPEPYASVLRAEAQRVVNAPLGLTAHDDLADVNQPYYFHEFIALAQGHALQYLSEAALSDMSDLAVAPEVRQSLQGLDGDLVRKEQYLDFMRGRSFRQTLLCHAKACERSPAPWQAIGGLLVTCDAAIDPQPAAEATGDWTYRRAGHLSITLSTAIANTLVQEAIAAWPGALSIDQIQERLALRQPEEAIRGEALAAMVWNLAQTGLIELRLTRAACATTIGRRPQISAFARWQARTAPEVTNLYHQMVHLEGPLLRALLPLLDGTRSSEQLAEEIAGQVRRGDLQPPAGLMATDPPALLASVTSAVASALETIRRLALLPREPDESSP